MFFGSFTLEEDSSISSTHLYFYSSKIFKSNGFLNEVRAPDLKPDDLSGVALTEIVWKCRGLTLDVFVSRTKSINSNPLYSYENTLNHIEQRSRKVKTLMGQFPQTNDY